MDVPELTECTEVDFIVEPNRAGVADDTSVFESETLLVSSDDDAAMASDVDISDELAVLARIRILRHVRITCLALVFVVVFSGCDFWGRATGLYGLKALSLYVLKVVLRGFRGVRP